MNNNLRQIWASTCFCRPVPTIEVNSDRYNNDEAYQKKIDNMLNNVKK